MKRLSQAAAIAVSSLAIALLAAGCGDKSPKAAPVASTPQPVITPATAQAIRADMRPPASSASPTHS